MRGCFAKKGWDYVGGERSNSKHPSLYLSDIIQPQKEGNPAFCDNMDGPRGLSCQVKFVRETQILICGIFFKKSPIHGKIEEKSSRQGIGVGK